MLRYRVRIARIVAAILTVTLSTQVAGAMVTNCMTVSETHANAGHAGMEQGEHGSLEAASPSAHKDRAPDHSSNRASCDQARFCTSVSPVPVTTTRSILLDTAAPPIFLGAGVLRGRSLQPDTPPPRT